VIRVRAPAKVNLSLAVLGRRADGFHEVDTRMLALELADLLEIERRSEPGVRLELAGPRASADIPADGTNLAARAAAEALHLAAGGAGLGLRLEKHIPSGSGLGGGSSDAAAAWIGAATLLGLDPWESAAEGLLAGLGSDCVFFWKAAKTGFARCTGRGERVEPLPAPASPRWVALLVPNCLCPTAAVYSAFQGSAGLPNDLEPAALRAVPELRPWREALDSCGETRWQLSGSGSAFFAPHDDPERARAALSAAGNEIAKRGLRPRGAFVTRVSGRGAEIIQVV